MSDVNQAPPPAELLPADWEAPNPPLAPDGPPQQAVQQEPPTIADYHPPQALPPVDVVEEPEPAPIEDPELVALRSALEAPGHAIGDAVPVPHHKLLEEVGFFMCGVDALGRVWRVEKEKAGSQLVLAGRLQT